MRGAGSTLTVPRVKVSGTSLLTFPLAAVKSVCFLQCQCRTYAQLDGASAWQRSERTIEHREAARPFGVTVCGPCWTCRAHRDRLCRVERCLPRNQLDKWGFLHQHVPGRVHLLRGEFTGLPRRDTSTHKFRGLRSRAHAQRNIRVEDAVTEPWPAR